MEYRFEVDFVKKANGNCPSKDFWDSLDKRVKAKFIAIAKAINKSSDGLLRDTDKFQKLHGRHTKLWEMKVWYNGIWYRMLCFMDVSKWLLTNGFTKKGNKTDMSEIEKGNSIQKEYYEMKEQKKNIMK